MKKQNKKLSKEQVNQSEKISDLISQIGKLNIDISNLRAEKAGLKIKVSEIEQARKDREIYVRALIDDKKQFKQKLISFIMEN